MTFCDFKRKKKGGAFPFPTPPSNIVLLFELPVSTDVSVWRVSSSGYGSA